MTTIKMSGRPLPPELAGIQPDSGGVVQKKFNLTASNWHAAFPGGSPVNDTTPGNFTNPSTAEVDRVPQLVLGALGTPGTYTITGTFDGATITEQITTMANSTVKGTQPFDTITGITGPDPGTGGLTLQMGDSYCTPACRFVYVASTTTLVMQLEGEASTIYNTISSLTVGRDLARRIKRVKNNGSSGDAFAVW